LKTNLNVKNLPCRIFEIADTFVPTPLSSVEGGKEGLPIERAKLALVCDSDFRQLRGVIEGLIKSLARDVELKFKPADLVWAEVGTEIIANHKTIGAAGIFSQAVREAFDFKDLVPCGTELDFEQLMALQKGPKKLKPIPRFPAIERDLSIIVDEQIRWADIFNSIKNKASTELEDILFVEIYRGKGIPKGRKSVTLSLRFRDQDGTLTHETVDRFQADIVQGLAESVGAELRTA
jgi:phenylalanyl-tRNA synthetase beta chain